jgi:glycosyltransferase involved in cell wall biosynthesis
VIHNCVTYSLGDMLRLGDAPTIKFWHDVGPWVAEPVREWIDENARPVCCSPMQAEHMGIDAVCVPPPVDLKPFEIAAASVNGSRSGTVSIGSWRNYGKAAHKVLEWADREGVKVDFYGAGPFAPQGSDDVAYDDMPQLLAGYERFVFLPAVIEPFGRLVVEAWAAGCSLVVNGHVGARYWIEEAPEKLATASEDFWKVVLS